MASGRGKLAILASHALLLAGLLLAPAANASSKPVMLILHPGGFIFGSPGDMAPAAEPARERGFRPLLVDYPLWNIAAARQSVRRAAKRNRQAGRDVYAYGESAGGTLAELLAQQGLVTAAAAQDPVSNVRRWANELGVTPYLGASQRLLRRVSPVFRGSPSKSNIRAFIGDDDATVGVAQATHRLAGRDVQVGTRGVPGGHLEVPFRTQAMLHSMRYLARRATRSAHVPQ
jgi:hypothetical protein